jgi:hypothetical protein
MTVYSTWPAWASRLLLLLGGILIVAAALARGPSHVVHLGPPNYDDRYFQRTLVERVANGENYYAAAAAQQRADSYPTAPATVFREPTLTWFLAQLSPVLRRTVLLLLVLAATIAMRERLDLTTLPKSLRLWAMLLQFTGFAIGLNSLQVYQHEVWAALLMALSLALYRQDRYWPSVALAVCACFVRELALPFIWAMAAFALWERRWREAAAWMAGMAVFLAPFAYHLWLASDLHRPGDIVSSGWLYLGGWNFVVETARKNLLLFYCPTWLVAAAIVLSVIGLAGWRDRWISRVALVTGGYLAAFLFVGRPDNQYWGYIYSPLLPLGWALAPAAIRDLVAQALPDISVWPYRSLAAIKSIRPGRAETP